MRTFKILAVVLVALAVSAVAVWLYIGHAAGRKWAAAQERIRQLSADHPVVLPPMPSTPATKEIQIHFVAAIRMAFRRQTRIGADPVDSVLEDAQDFLERLHQAGRLCAASAADFPPGWRGEWDSPTVWHMMECCSLRARQLRDQNQPFEAAETVLDALQLGRFWAASGKADPIPAMKGVRVSIDLLMSILSREPLSRDQLLRLDQELVPLEESLRSPLDSIESGVARWGEWLAGLDPKIPTNQWILDGAPYRWRYFLPFDLMRAEAFEFYDLHGRRLVADRGSSFLEMDQHFRQMADQGKGTKNPILDSGFAFWPWEWIEFERMAQLRLLRIGARYRASGEVLPLKDPFGDSIRQARTESRMKFWSLGKDGVDHGGDREKDILLEVDHPKPE